MIVHDVEQNSPEWYALRAGIPTASAFSRLVTPKGKPSTQIEGYAMTLAGEKFAGKQVDPFMGNDWTNRGHLLEEEATEYYEFVTGKTVEKSGFITDNKKRAGCSPDRLIGKGGLLEIKCLKGENHIKAVMHIKENNTCPDDYYLQVQGQLLVCGKRFVDVLFYHPLLPSKFVRVYKVPETQKLLRKQLKLVNKRRDKIYSFLSDDKMAA